MKGAARLLAPWTWPKVGSTPSDVVFAENKLRVLHYRSDRSSGRPVLLVPSVINRHYVLDLLPGKSFVEYLVAKGHDVYAIDWGTPGDEDKDVSFSHVVDRYLGRVVRHVARRSGQSVHLFGYCLGGTLAAIHAILRPEPIASVALVAAPIDFHDNGLLSQWTRSRTFDVDTLVDGYGNVPWQVMQSAFHLLRPTLGMWKAVRLIEKASDDEFVDGFLAMETWGNDNVSFPGECYREYVRRLYQDNALIKGDLWVSGSPVRLDQLQMPLMVVTFEHDHIVPKSSATAILDKVQSKDRTHLHLVGGHVGAMVAKSAAKGLWPGLSGFWRAHDGRVTPELRVEPVAPAAESASVALAAQSANVAPAEPRVQTDIVPTIDPDAPVAPGNRHAPVAGNAPNGNGQHAPEATGALSSSGRRKKSKSAERS